jgi:hydroxymethylpyrimidine/phosphomethylpyrimidine kinase
MESITDGPQPVVLTVAGYDPSAGAGILADLKTISYFGCYGVAAITSITFQNTQGVAGARNQSNEVVCGQIKPLLDDFQIRAVKTGMLPSPQVVMSVAQAIVESGAKHIVVDPVLRSTSGVDLARESIGAIIGHLLPIASLITPNVAEAEALTGIKVGDETTMRLAAQAIIEMGARAVLVKGGDLGGDQAPDLLMDSLGAILFSGARVQSRDTHGTGCALSSAIACLLARGQTLRVAVPSAKQYVAAAIRTAPGLGKGHGPLNHFPPGPQEWNTEGHG